MHYMVHPGINLAKWMKARNMGENELARRSKVPQPTIHRILTQDSKDPKRSTLAKLVRPFGRTVDDLYQAGDTEERKALDKRADRLYDDSLTDEQLEAIRRLIDAFRS